MQKNFVVSFLFFSEVNSADLLAQSHAPYSVKNDAITGI